MRGRDKRYCKLGCKDLILPRKPRSLKNSQSKVDTSSAKNSPSLEGEKKGEPKNSQGLVTERFSTTQQNLHETQKNISHSTFGGDSSISIRHGITGECRPNLQDLSSQIVDTPLDLSAKNQTNFDHITSNITAQSSRTNTSVMALPSSMSPESSDHSNKHTRSIASNEIEFESQSRQFLSSRMAYMRNTPSVVLNHLQISSSVNRLYPCSQSCFTSMTSLF